jgi:hypothetical protein
MHQSDGHAAIGGDVGIVRKQRIGVGVAGYGGVERSGSGKSNAPCLSPQKSIKMGPKPRGPGGKVSRENIHA